MLFENIFGKIYRRNIDAQMKIGFMSGLIAGMLSHGYMLTNKLPNYDDIKCMINDYGTGIESGRWMLSILGVFVKKTMGNYSLPWFNGILSICIISIAACMIIRTFEIKDRVLCALTGAIMVSFPAIAGILFFMYTSIFYSIAILLSITAVFCIRKYKYGLIYGILLLSASIGIYQSYFSLAAALLIILLIRECLVERSDWRDILLLGLKYLALLLGALFVYMMCLHILIFAMGIQLVDYQGINQMGNINLRDMPLLVLKAYQNYIQIFYKDKYGFNIYPVLKVVLVLLHLVVLFLIFRGIYKKKIVIIASALFLTFLFPLAVNLIYVMAPSAYVYSIMMYPMVTVYLFPIILSEIFLEDFMKNGIIVRGIQWFSVIMLLFVIILQSQYNNVEYLAMNMQYEQAYSYLSSLLTRIRSTDGYNMRTPVVFIGDTISDSAFYKNDEFKRYNFEGRSQDLVNVYSREYFLRRYLGFNQMIVEEENIEEDMQGEIGTMAVYPDDGSIRMIGGKIIVKLEDNVD